MSERASTVVFLHIPKTAGTTFNTLLSWQYIGRSSYWMAADDLEAKGFTSLPEKRRSQIQLLRGHMMFGLHQHIPRPCRYITFMRDPVARVLSYVHSMRRDAAPVSDAKDWHARDYRTLTLRQLFDARRDVELENGCVRRLSSLGFSKRYCTSADLDRALEHVDQHFDFIGITERFEESIILAKRALGWRLPLLYETSKVSDRSDWVDSSEDIELILKHNSFDMQLYQFACARFEHQIRQLKGDIVAQIVALKQRQTIVRPAVAVARRILSLHS